MNACTVHCNNVFGTSNKGAQQICSSCVMVDVGDNSPWAYVWPTSNYI